MITTQPQWRRQRARLLCQLVLLVPTLLLVVPGAWAQQPQPAPYNEYQVGAILWAQTAGEARALYYQAYTLARLMLDRDLKEHHKGKLPRAVVVDVDETVLDNSPFQASLVKEHKDYTQQAWAAWTASAQAAALPGAVEFLRYADSKGVRVFYITNRKIEEKAGTMANLTKAGFPNVNDETLLLRTDTSSKETRRKVVAARYRIVLLLGDNLNDFSDVFEKQTVAERLAAVEQNKDRFGTHFIVLPNAMYGDWETAIYHNLAPGETHSQRRLSTLKTPAAPQ
jgi:5'-nucleotidase (lipoprotein e(P4) family)